jgi:5-formyltetrahydrofolate cyclo-ligase
MKRVVVMQQELLRKQAKAALRKRLNALRRALPAQSVADRSQRIVERLLQHPYLVNARSVALFSAMPEKREVDLTELHQRLSERGLRIYYPFMDPTPEGYRMAFRLLGPGDVLAKQTQRFAEPNPSAPAAARGDLDLLVVPALGITLQGYRLGFGAGFYDAALPDFCPPAKSICVGFDFQRLIELPVEEHDVACDAVVTDAEDPP